MQKAPTHVLKRGEKTQKQQQSVQAPIKDLLKHCIKKKKEVRRIDKGPKNNENCQNSETRNDKCYYCGRDRHPSDGTRYGWRNMCPAKNATCQDCNSTGHFAGMIACKRGKVNCIKIGSSNRARSTNIIEGKQKEQRKLFQYS